MSAKTVSHPVSEQDSLHNYIEGVGKLPQKLGVIAENQRHAAASLGRAVLALRSIAALNSSPSGANSKNHHPAFRNARAAN